MVAFIIALAALAFGSYHLGMYRQLAGHHPVSPSQAMPAKKGSVVGVAQPWEAPQPSPATGHPVLWSRAYHATRYVSGSRRKGTASRATHRKNLGKVRTHFQLIDEVDGASAVAVDSTKLGDTAVTVKQRRYQPSRGTGRIEERAIYPGDRVWVHGKLEDQGSYLGFARRGVIIHDRPPEARRKTHSTYAMLGLVAAVIAGVIGAVLVLTG